MGPSVFFKQRIFHLQLADGRIKLLDIGRRGKGCQRSGKNLRGLLAQLQLPARDLGRGQLVAGSQVGQRLALGERSQRHLGFELGRMAKAGAFEGHNRAKLARFFCPTFGEYYTNLQARVFGFPGVKRGLAEAVLMHNVRHDLPALFLLKDSDDLRFTESILFHKEESIQ